MIAAWEEPWARLLAFREHLPDNYELHERLVRRYHDVISQLETATGVSLQNFRIPDDEIRPKVVAVRMGSFRRPGYVNYSDENYCERTNVLMRLDGVIRFLQPRLASLSQPPHDANAGAKPAAVLSASAGCPKIFISYSWDSESHKQWVASLASRLRTEGGLDVTLDRWHVQPGDQLTRFMESAVRENDYVLIVCTPGYRRRSDQRTGGVGYEGDIMTAEVYASANHRKFVPLLREGEWRDAAPSWVSGKCWLDFRGDPYPEHSYDRLIGTLHGELDAAPPIGPRPQFATDRRSSEKPR